MKKINNKFLQKYVDHKLDSIHAECDDLSDYLQNYTDDKCWVTQELLKEQGISPNEFVYKFKTNITDVKNAIIKSEVLNTLAERYKAAVIKGISKEIFNDILPQDKEYIKEEIKFEGKLTSDNQTVDSALKKLKKAGLNKKEIKALKRYLDD